MLDSFLTGVRILDLSQNLPGPLASLMLADMGADVVKIEPPRGDDLRAMEPRGKSGRSVYYDAVNAGKRVLKINLKSNEGRADLKQRVRDADVLLESFRPGTLDRLGVGYETLKIQNAGLIYCALSGFGKNSPLRDQAGHDANYQALAGSLDANGPPEKPALFLPPLADCSAGLYAVSAILGALIRRGRTGEGCEVDLALTDSVMPLMTFELAALGATGQSPTRGAGLLGGGAACYRIYETADRAFVTLAAVEPRFWQGFCEAAGKPEWIERHAEPLPQTALIGEVDAWFATVTRAEAEAILAPADCCFAPVKTLAEAVNSPHFKARRLVHDADATGFQALFPAWVDGRPPRPRAPLQELHEKAPNKL